MNTPHFRVGLSVIFMLLAAFSCERAYSQESSRAVISASNFIFYGTIEKMNASNISVTANGPTAIVKVNQIIDAVQPYQLMEGKEITVLLAPGQDRQAGTSQVFYTTGWYYGKTLGVKEIPNRQPRELQPALKESIARERVNIHNDSLQQELAISTLVVRGLVVQAEIGEKEKPSEESEHDPEYRRAIIEVEAVLKGNSDSKRITVVYSSSDDVMWSRSPKLKKGMEQIFLLQSKQAPALFPVQDYTLLDARDVQPLTSLSLMQSMLK